jgi:hypothetical protein
MSGKSPSAAPFFIQNGDTTSNQHEQPRKQPMVELIESNTKLNKDLDQVRKEYKQCLYDIEATKENIERHTQTDRLKIEEQTKTAVQERDDLFKTLEAAQTQELVEVQENEFKAKVARDQAHNRLRVAQEAFLDQHKHFWESCNEYRTKIQRLSFQGECRENGAHTDKAKFTTNNAQLQEEWSQDLVTTLSKMAGILDVGNYANDDVELEEALQELEKRKTDGKMVHTCLEEVLKEKAAAFQSQEKRNVHKNGLQAQFQRLNDDVEKLRSQIKNFQQQTNEANNMTLIYQKGKEKGISDISGGTFRLHFVLFMLLYCR